MLKTNGKLTLENISFLYRNATLARQLGLLVQDLLTAIDLTGINPFESSQSQNTQRFIEAVTAINDRNVDDFLDVLRSRVKSVEQESKRKRIEAVIRKLSV